LKRFFRFLLIATVFATTLVGCGSSGSPSEEALSSSSGETSGVGNTVLNVAIQPSAAFVPLYVVKENGWLEDALEELGVTVNWTEFESGPPMNESFAAGQQDIGVIGDVPSITALAAGYDNTIVGIGAYGVEAYTLLVPSDSGIDSISGLKGKTIGLTVGSTAHNLVDKILEANDLDINEDVEIVNLSSGDLQTTLETEQVDAIATWEPNTTRITDNGTAVILADGTGVLRGVNVIFGRTDYLAENPEVVKIFLEQYARGNKELRENTKETTEAITEYFSISAEQLQKVIEKYHYTVTVTDEDIEELQSTSDFLVKIEAIEKGVNVSDYIDTSYCDDADLAKYAVDEE